MAIAAGETDTCMDVSIGEVNMSKELHTVWLVLRPIQQGYLAV